MSSTLTWKTAVADARIKINHIPKQSFYNDKRFVHVEGSNCGILLRKVESFQLNEDGGAKEDDCYVIYLEHPLNSNPDSREIAFANDFMFMPDPRHILLVKREAKGVIEKVGQWLSWEDKMDIDIIQNFLCHKETHWDPNKDTCSPDTIFKCCKEGCARYIQKKQGYTLCQESSHICCIGHLTEVNREYALNDESKCKTFKGILESFGSPHVSSNLFKAQVMCCYGATGDLTDPKQNTLFKEFAENDHIPCPCCVEIGISTVRRVTFKKLESQWRAFRSMVAPASSNGKGCASEPSKAASDLPAPGPFASGNINKGAASQYPYQYQYDSNPQSDHPPPPARMTSSSGTQQQQQPQQQQQQLENHHNQHQQNQNVQGPNHNFDRGRDRDRDRFNGQNGYDGYSGPNGPNGPNGFNQNGPNGFNQNGNRQGSGSSSNFNSNPNSNSNLPPPPPTAQFAPSVIVSYKTFNPKQGHPLDVFVGCPEIRLKRVKINLERGMSVAVVISRILSILQGSRYIVPSDFKIYCKVGLTGTWKELITDDKYYDFMADYSNHHEPLDGRKVFDFFRDNPDKTNRRDISEQFMTIHQISSCDELSLRRGKEATVEPCQGIYATALLDRYNAYLFGSIGELSPQYYGLRKIRGDGNCYYRSIIYGLIENIILNRDYKRLMLLRDRLAEAKNARELGTLLGGKKIYSTDRGEYPTPPSYRNFLQDLDWLLCKIDATVDNFMGLDFKVRSSQENCTPWQSIDDFEEDILAIDLRLDHILILTCRILESDWALKNEEKEMNGLPLNQLMVALELESVIDYCLEFTMRWCKSAEGPLVEMAALSEALQCDITLVYKPRERPKGGEVMAPRVGSYTGPNKVGSVSLTLRPGHYDLLCSQPLDANPRISRGVDQMQLEAVMREISQININGVYLKADIKQAVKLVVCNQGMDKPLSFKAVHEKLNEINEKDYPGFISRYQRHKKDSFLACSKEFVAPRGVDPAISRLALSTSSSLPPSQPSSSSSSSLSSSSSSREFNKAIMDRALSALQIGANVRIIEDFENEAIRLRFPEAVYIANEGHN